MGISTISVSGSLANTYNIRKTLLDRHTEIDFSSKTDFRQSGRLSKMKKTVFLRVKVGRPLVCLETVCDWRVRARSGL